NSFPFGDKEIPLISRTLCCADEIGQLSRKLERMQLACWGLSSKCSFQNRTKVFERDSYKGGCKGGNKRCNSTVDVGYAITDYSSNEWHVEPVPCHYAT